MDALVSGEVQGKLSAVAFLSLLRAKADQAGGQDLADLAEPLGGGHQIGVEGVVQNRYLRGRDDTEDKRGWFKRTMMSDS
jgi:hypothetical protein